MGTNHSRTAPDGQQFPEKQNFVLAPFPAIGIIAGFRGLLLLEAQTSFMQVFLSTGIVIILTVTCYLLVTTQRLSSNMLP